MPLSRKTPKNIHERVEEKVREGMKYDQAINLTQKMSDAGKGQCDRHHEVRKPKAKK